MQRTVSFGSKDLSLFGAMIKKMLNGNFSNLTDEQHSRIRDLEAFGKNYLTFPVSPFSGDKWIEIEGEIYETGGYRPWKEGNMFETLTTDGRYKWEFSLAANPYEDGYREDCNAYDLGHQLVEISHDLILRNPIFVARSGYGVYVELPDGGSTYEAATIAVSARYSPEAGVYIGRAEISSPVPGYYWRSFNKAWQELCIFPIKIVKI